MNEIEHTIQSTPEGKAKYDEILKTLLANKQFLSRIMKRFVSEFSACSLDDIENKYIEPDSISVSKTGVSRNSTNIEGLSNEDKTWNEGTIFYDILFRAVYPGTKGTRIGMYLNLEFQNSYYPGYPLEMRGTYYAARRFSSQLKSIHHHTNYGCLQKVYSIWLCIGDVPDYEANTATLYHTVKYDMIGSVKRSSDVYDLINVIMLRINDKVEIEDNVLKLLQVLCSNHFGKKEKIEFLKQAGIRMNREIEEGVNLIYTAGDWIEKQAMEKGLEKGLEEGLEKGIKLGESNEKRGTVIRSYERNKSIEEAAFISDSPVETVTKWLQEADLI